MNRMRILGYAAAVALIAVPATSAVAQQVPGTSSTQGIKSGHYQIDGTHTQVMATVIHFGFNPYFILFGEAEGALHLEPANLAASKISVTIPASSIKTNNDKLTEHLRSKDFFDVEQFPTLSFASTAVKPTGKTTADIAGNLTVHGVTRPVILKASFTGQGMNPMTKAATVGFTATTAIKRSDFGISYGVPMVSDEVELKITTAFEQKAG